MRNREKFRDEIVKAIKSRETCEFMNYTVIPEFIGSKTDSKCICEMGDCRACLILFTLWLDEEYEMSETDWNKVPVDTLVRVRNSENENWTPRHFKRIRDTTSTHRFETWDDGKTSKTTDGLIMLWNYCELVEEV